MLTQEEAVTAVRACAALGITKVRITGGEPLVKRDLINLCFGIAGVEGIETVALTTNATLLSADTARDLIRAGVSRINISLDTLDPEKYRMLTRTGDLKQALDVRIRYFAEHGCTVWTRPSGPALQRSRSTPS